MKTIKSNMLIDALILVAGLCYMGMSGFDGFSIIFTVMVLGFILLIHGISIILLHFTAKTPDKDLLFYGILLTIIMIMGLLVVYSGLSGRSMKIGG